MYTKSITHYISKVVVDILFYLSLLCTLLIPFVARRFFEWIDYPHPLYVFPFSLTLFLSGAGCSFILLKLKLMFRSLLSGNPFIDENVCHFRHIAVTCAVIALIYAIKCVFAFTLATLVICIIFTVGTLFCLTLKDLFKQAINYKTENELTI